MKHQRYGMSRLLRLNLARFLPLSALATLCLFLHVCAPGSAQSQDSTSTTRSAQASTDVNAWFDAQQAPKLRQDVLDQARKRRENWPDFKPIDLKQLERLGIARIEIGRVCFYSDVDLDDELLQIPEALNAAIPKILEFFDLTLERLPTLRVEAFLIHDYQKFVTLGALDGPPDFLHGYSLGDRIFANLQTENYYTRFLLLHELTHTIMHELFGDLNPQWFSEGMADYVAAHVWNGEHKNLQLAQFPQEEKLTPGFARLRQIRELVRAGQTPTLREILNFQPKNFADVSAYSWSWALVAFLLNTEDYRAIAETMPYWALEPHPNQLFIDAIGSRWGRLEFQWSAYLATLDYGYDFTASALAFEPLAPTENTSANVEVASCQANRGWQNSGVTLHAGATYRLTASGRYDFYVEQASRAMPFEAPGATFFYYDNHPLGRLCFATLPAPQEQTFEDFYSSAMTTPSRATNEDSEQSNGSVSRSRRAQAPTQPKRLNNLMLDALLDPLDFDSPSVVFTAEYDAILWMKVNAPSRNLAQNSGDVRVKIERSSK
ncbi:MAG: hypothetical protein Q4G03_01945 [Planctomycetia bacterium]|nr:hypothetical protein [Planctomycetia bacterium]